MNSSPLLNALTNRCIVLHLVKSGATNFEDLYEMFGRSAEVRDDIARVKFRKRLEYLVYVDRVVIAPGGRFGNRIYAAGEEGKNPKPKRVSQAKPKPAPKPKRYAELQSAARTGQVVLPREVNVMHGPLYVPPSAPFYRPGALDFKSLPSRGHRC